MSKLAKYCQTGGMKTDRAVTFPKLSKLEIDKINQANQKRLFEEKQAQLNSKTTPTTQAVRNIGQKIDRDKRINLKQDRANLLGLALSPIPVIGEVYNSGNTIANIAVDLAQKEYEDALLSAGLYGLSKIPFSKKTKNNTLSNNYDSEIDWNKWNNEISKNKKLLQEYYDIEQKAKQNGTWMKDSKGNPLKTPDGTLATPEQFVQLNSKRGKEFLGKDYENINQVYRGTYNKTTRKNLKPDKAVFTANKELAKEYVGINNYNNPKTLTSDSRYFNFFDNFSDKDNFGGMFNLAHKKSPKSVEFTGNKDNWVDINLDKINTDDNLPELQKMKNYLGNRVSTNKIAKYVEDNNLDYIKINNIIDGGLGDVSIINNKKGNYLKSLVGNNGNFDLNNSNVFKSLVPITGASILYNQNNKQTGGMNKLSKYCQTGIKISPSKKGTFKSQATKMGMGVQEAAETILNAPEGKYTSLMRRKANFAKNFAKQTGGQNGIIAEAGEFYKDENGQIKQINPETVTHDDYMLIDEQGNYISEMPYNQGGVVVDGVESVLSASHENRESNEPSYKQADEEIRIKPKEGKEFAKRFNFNNIKFNGGSPSKLFESVLDAKTKKLKKYNNIEYNENSPYGINSSKANGAYIQSLPQDEMIYDEIFNYQESKKQENLNKFMQTGGKGILSPFPEMYGNKPVAMVNIKGKLYPATTVNGRTVSMDDVFNKRDSVELKNFKAIKLNKNERFKK